MKKYILLLITPLMIFAQTYMAKVEPYETLTIYAQSSGQIIKMNKNDETKVVNKTLIKIDDSLDQSKLSIFTKQLSLYSKKLKILEDSYKKYMKIRGKSQAEKDDKLFEVIEQQISIESLKSSIEEMKNSISRKTIDVKNLYIKEFNVNKGDYVSIGNELATAYDISKSKLIVYVSSDDYKNIRNKKILIDSKSDIATIEKVDITVDDIYVSSYKVTLLINNKEFGKVLKVEFKK